MSVPSSPVLQQFQPNTSASLSNFFSSTTNSGNPFACLTDSSLAKSKRCRQRVDAGEPRNNYQGSMMSQSKTNIDSVLASAKNGHNEQDEDNDSVDQPTEDNEILLSADNQQSDFELSDEYDESSRQEDTAENSINFVVPTQPPNDLPILVKNDPTENRHSNNSAMSSSSSKRKRFQPQKQSLKQEHSAFDSNDESNYDEKLESSENNSTDNIAKASGDLSNLSSLQKELANRSNPPASSQPNAIASTLASSLNAKNAPQYQQNMFANNVFMEMQRRMYASALNQQQQNQQNQQNGRNEEENNSMVKDAVMKDFVRFVQTLNEKFMTAVQKMSSDFSLTETEKALFQQLKQQKEQKQPDWRSPQTFGMPNTVGTANMNGINPLFNPLNLPYANPRLLAMAANQNQLNSLANNMPSQNSSTNSTANTGNSPFSGLLNNPANTGNKMSNSSIFPTPMPNFPPFNGFVNHAVANSLGKSDDGSPRKKRSKVTDSVRGPRSAVRDNGHSLPASSRSSPQPNGYFPPTMVSHPLYNNTSFKMDRTSQSPGNSDEFSDYGLDSSYSQSSTLTHVHLRKAKLMFFYTRYPSSSVLKSYFPDINFNKGNTAQLVKWFSNFREFYYMQMEKFAKQAIAEGITDANEIFVTTESEIYKQLNQHYNRNNFITPPDSLANVIEETLKEFFRALKEGRDTEPSWKKSIYKIIQQLDEHIPEHFKGGNFMIQLEGNQP